MKDKTVVILAGGKSRRMGTDKRFLQFGEKALLSFTVGRYSKLFSRVILSVAKPENLDYPGVLQVVDTHQNAGPMAGLYAAFTQTDADEVFLTAADMPFASPELALHIMDLGQEYPICLIRPKSRFVEPLFAMYKRSCLPVIEQLLNDGRLSMLEIINHFPALILEEDHLSAYGFAPAEDTFFNINSPDDFKLAINKLKYYGTTKRPIISVVGKSGTGKTTYLERLIPELKKRGLLVGVIKHDAHEFEIDIPGKDSWRITQAGADITAISSEKRAVVMEKRQNALVLDELAARMENMDIILTEGYKAGTKPKIEIYRAARSVQLLCDERELLAIVTDDPVESAATCVSFSDLESMADMIEDFINRCRELS